jgi:xyloglucan-specific exo-beta-1,4-glucanase
MSGFRHSSLTEPPEQTYENNSFGDTTGIDFCEADPNIVVRVGSAPGAGGREDSQVRAAYSADNGRTWGSFAEVPVGAVNGKIAVSATLQPNGQPILVWAPQGDVYPHRSLDGGEHWLPVKGAPNHTTEQLWFSSQAIASDRVDGSTFYLYKHQEKAPTGEFYRSRDGGETWVRTVSDLPNYYLHTVKAAPGMAGEVWFTTPGERLYRSSDYGSTFTPLAQVEKVVNFAFGKPAPRYQHPTVFVSGTIQGVEGFFRSDNATSLYGAASEATWVKISTQQQALGTVNYVEGDQLNFGRVYVGTGGRGILYGEPVSP